MEQYPYDDFDTRLALAEDVMRSFTGRGRVLTGVPETALKCFLIDRPELARTQSIEIFQEMARPLLGLISDEEFAAQYPCLYSVMPGGHVVFRMESFGWILTTVFCDFVTDDNRMRPWGIRFSDLHFADGTWSYAGNDAHDGTASGTGPLH